MPERILFLTGSLAERRLKRALEAMAPEDFDWEVRPIGVKVAALMTTEIIRRRLKSLSGATRVLLPGRSRVNLAALSAEFGAPFERGPDDLKDLPRHFGRAGGPVDLSRHDMRLFAEIVEAPTLSLDRILARAAEYRAAGADVIDLGCLPDTPFPHLEEAVEALKSAGHAVSVDSGMAEELRRGQRAGADFLLSLTERTLKIAEEGNAVPVLIPAEPGDLDSLTRAVETMLARGRPFLADPVLDPIHFGFTDSLMRYRDLRRRFPEIELLMGIGNLTELTDADSPGVTALLSGVCSELRIRNLLVVRVSPHCRRAIEEADAARRLFFAARELESPPMNISDALIALHERRPFPNTPEEIAELQRDLADRNWRIEAAEDGIHLYNRDRHEVAADAFALFPALRDAVDAPHAFYLGVELARAQIAFQLGKRYVQDRELDWGVAVPRAPEELDRFAAPGATLAKGAPEEDEEA
jgi:dihydropteroate synthase-like protein